MSDIAFLATIAGVYFMLAVSPGPNFLVITTTAVSQSRRLAIFTGLGVSTASVFWAGLAALGLGTLFAQFAWTQRVLQFFGGTYLLYVGVRIFMNAATPIAIRDVGSLGQSLWQAYRFGLATNLTNPKTLVFFSSTFAVLFRPGISTAMKIAAVAVVLCISVGWNVIVATVFSSDVARRAYVRAKTAIDRTTGGLLTIFGMKLVANV
jgi:threonine efflux protein